MDLSLKLNVPLPVLPATCSVFQGGCQYEFEVEPFEYRQKLLEYAGLHTNNQIVVAYPRCEDEAKNVDCDIFRLGTAMNMSVCEPVVRKGELWSYAIETDYTRKVRIESYTYVDGVRLARCVPYRERPLRLTSGQIAQLIMPLWVSVRCNQGLLDHLQVIFPSLENARFRSFLEQPDDALEQICANIPLEFSQQAAYFNAENILERAELVLQFLNTMHSQGMQIDRYDATLNTLKEEHQVLNVSLN